MASPVDTNDTSRGKIEAIKADLETGLADVAAGRARPFDTARIIEQGRAHLNERLRGSDFAREAARQGELLRSRAEEKEAIHRLIHKPA